MPPSNKTILITGAGGFIGLHAVRLFAEHNWKVYALIHRSLPEELKTMSGVEIIKGSVTDKDITEKILAHTGARPAIVLHAAGLASDTGPDEIYRITNFEPVKTLSRLPEDKFIFLSSTDVYGIKDFNGEDEETLPFETKPLSPYPKYKIEAEKWLRANMPADKYVILRPAAVYGEGDKSVSSRIISFLAASPFIAYFGKWKGQNRWPAAAVKNVAKTAFAAACVNDFDGKAVNIIDDSRMSMEDFYWRLVKENFPDKKFKSITLPFWFGKLIGLVSTSISNLLGRTTEIFDPSFYAVHHVASNLDFSCARQNKALEIYERITVEEKSPPVI